MNMNWRGAALPSRGIAGHDGGDVWVGLEGVPTPLRANRGSQHARGVADVRAGIHDVLPDLGESEQGLSGDQVIRRASPQALADRVLGPAFEFEPPWQLDHKAAFRIRLLSPTEDPPQE